MFSDRLAEIKIEGLPSLKSLNLEVNSAKEVSFKNLNALKQLTWNQSYSNKCLIEKCHLEQLPKIEKLFYQDNLSKFSFIGKMS